VRGAAAAVCVFQVTDMQTQHCNFFSIFALSSLRFQIKIQFISIANSTAKDNFQDKTFLVESAIRFNLKIMVGEENNKAYRRKSNKQ